MASVLEVATDRQGWLCMNCVKIPSRFRAPYLGQGGHGDMLYEWRRKVRHKYRRWYHADESAREILRDAGQARNLDRPAARAAVACCVVEIANEIVRGTGKYGGKDIIMKVYAHLCPFVGKYNAPPRVPPPLHPPPPPPPPPLLVHVNLRDDVNRVPLPYPQFGFSNSDDDSDDDSDDGLMAI